MEISELSIIDIIKLFISKWWLFVICAVLIAAGTFVYSSYFIQPMYQSTTTLYVDPNPDQPFNLSTDAAGITYAQKVISTYMELLKTQVFLKSVSQDIYGKYTADQISKMITLSAVTNTELFKVTVKSNDPEDAHQIAQSFERLAPQRIIEVKGVNAVKIADPAVLSETRINNNTLKNTAIGFILGLVLAAGICILIELFDTKIKDEVDIEQHYKLNILGVIPNFEVSSSDKYSYKSKY